MISRSAAGAAPHRPPLPTRWVGVMEQIIKSDLLRGQEQAKPT